MASQFPVNNGAPVAGSKDTAKNKYDGDAVAGLVLSILGIMFFS